jgi:hypothetical protein
MPHERPQAVRPSNGYPGTSASNGSTRHHETSGAGIIVNGSSQNAWEMHVCAQNGTGCRPKA